jgi:hypothetical protein
MSSETLTKQEKDLILTKELQAMIFGFAIGAQCNGWESGSQDSSSSIEDTFDACRNL